MQIFALEEFTNPIKIITAFDNESFLEAFSQIEILRKRPDTYLLGYIRYEAKEIFLGRKIKSEYPLLYFETFTDAKIHRCIDTKQNPSHLVTQSLSHLIDYPTYAKAIEQIKEEISEGNTYQVNYTYDWEIQTQLEGFELYKSILPSQTTPYNAYIKNQYEEILSFSPELFFELEDNKIKTKPMKGTVKRGETKQKDEKNIEFLKNDIKNRAENVMIVDLLRNDLGKIAKTGTVRVEKLFEVETHKTLHQMTSEISAEIEENTTLYDIFEALFPCGSVTGAPKINTMEIIDFLEIGKRDVYCGAIGLISPEKTVFSVPIRILQRHFSRHCEEGQSPDAAISSESQFICRVGGAIVWDSTPQDEWEETLTKISFLTNKSCHYEEGVNDLTLAKERSCHCEKSCLQDDEAIQKECLGLLRRNFVSPRNDIKLIETMLVENGKIMYEEEHFKRIKQSAEALGFKFGKWETVKGKWKTDCILRILLDKEGVFEMQTSLVEPIKTNIITVSKTPINSKEPLLYYKTTYRPWYENAMKKIKNSEIFDEIFFNEKGELTEGARSNIVLQINGELFTPPVKCGLLKGILRQELLKQDKIKEKKLYLSDLQNAEKVFCINSVRGIVEVTLPLHLRDSAEQKLTKCQVLGEVAVFNVSENSRTLENRVGGKR